MVDEETTGEIQKVREETQAYLRRGAYFWIIMVLTSVGSAGIAICVSTVNTHRSERKLCSVVVTSDDNYHRNRPVTPIGRDQAANFSRLRRELGCPPYKG
jgi:hypothetical protein